VPRPLTVRGVARPRRERGEPEGSAGRAASCRGWRARRTRGVAGESRRGLANSPEVVSAWLSFLSELLTVARRRGRCESLSSSGRRCAIVRPTGGRTTCVWPSEPACPRRRPGQSAGGQCRLSSTMKSASPWSSPLCCATDRLQMTWRLERPSSSARALVRRHRR
jgi:hypothetical protein